MAPLSPSRLIALACCRISAGTVCGSSADEAGNENADTAPLTAASTTSSGMVARPVSTAAAASAWLSAARVLAAIITGRRGNRSAITPPASRTSTLVSDLAATTTPRSRTDPVRSSTVNASAIGATAPPSMLIVLPMTSQRNGAWRSAPRESTQIIRMPSSMTGQVECRAGDAGAWRASAHGNAYSTTSNTSLICDRRPRILSSLRAGRPAPHPSSSVRWKRPIKTPGDGVEVLPLAARGRCCGISQAVSCVGWPPFLPGTCRCSTWGDVRPRAYVSYQRMPRGRRLTCGECLRAQLAIRETGGLV